uniref:Uncharacterized protein n=1 Tax=Anopheles dirus TaxID=7168 RepID=A0A182N7K8_9DIPT
MPMRKLFHHPATIGAGGGVDGSEMGSWAEEGAIDVYPRVLEHIINTQSPQLLCRDYKEILGTLDIISTDPECEN